MGMIIVLLYLSFLVFFICFGISKIYEQIKEIAQDDDLDKYKRY